MASIVNKKDLRKLASLKRQEAALSFSKNKRLAFNKNLQKVIVNHENYSVVSAFLSIGDEIDVRPAMEYLFTAGRKCVLPVVITVNEPLIFREWKPGLKLHEGLFGTRHPGPKMKELAPDLLVIPLLAFDQEGSRLGWGGGYYDRTISELRSKKDKILTVGVGYQAQAMDNIPQTKFDEKLDIIVTEGRIISVRNRFGETN